MEVFIAALGNGASGFRVGKSGCGPAASKATSGWLRGRVGREVAVMTSVCLRAGASAHPRIKPDIRPLPPPDPLHPPSEPTRNPEEPRKHASDTC
jgi:hypothetical protein